MNLPTVAVQGRPTEARTLFTGILGSVAALFTSGATQNPSPGKVTASAIPALVGGAAHVWTWLVSHGGLKGVVLALWHGNQ